MKSKDFRGVASSNPHIAIEFHIFFFAKFRVEKGGQSTSFLQLKVT